MFIPVTIPTLATRRLALRKLELSDAGAIQRQFPFMNIVRYLNPVIPWPYPADGALQFIRDLCIPDMQAGKAFHWAITLKSQSDDLIGVISLRPQSEENRGFWLALPYQGRGLMKEAAMAVTDFAFDGLGMAVLKLKNAEPNGPSHRIKERAGATITGIDSSFLYRRHIPPRSLAVDPGTMGDQPSPVYGSGIK